MEDLVQPQAGTKRVLILDDDLIEQAQFSAMFRKISSRRNIPIETRTVGNLKEALHALKDCRLAGTPYDLILADVHLGRFENTLHLRSECRKKYPELNFVYTSGRGAQEILGRRWENDLPISFISKAIYPGKFMHELEHHLFRSEPTDQSMARWQNVHYENDPWSLLILDHFFGVLWTAICWIGLFVVLCQTLFRVVRG